MSNLKRITTILTGMPGLPGTTTLYGHEDGISTSDQVDAVKSWWDDMAPNLHSTLAYSVQGVVEIVDSTTGAITGLDDTGANRDGTGSAGGEVLPLATQFLVRWRTGTFFSGRELRGRSFIPGGTEGENTGGVPDGGTLASLLTAAANIVDNNFAVYSPTHHQWASITSASMFNEWAVLRSRRQ